MKESRVFELNQVTAEQVLEAVTTFLRGEKGMEVQNVATPNGYLIQAAQADTLRTLSGMKLATTVELTVNGTQLNVTLGEGQWADKLGAGAVGLFLLWPLAVTAGIGAYKQKKLPSEIFEVVYRCTMGEPTGFRTAGVPVNAAPTAPAGGSLSAVRGADLCKREVLQRLRRKATNGVSGLRRAGKAGQ